MISDDDIKRARELSALLTNGSELPASVWALQDERFSAGKVIDALLAEREVLGDRCKSFFNVVTELELEIDALKSEGDALRADAEIGKVVWDFVDRMNDVCEEDRADKILLQFVEAVMPKIETASDAARKEQA